LRKYFPLNRQNAFKIIETHKKVETTKIFQKMLKQREIFWIAELNTYDPQQIKGWNLTKGGDGTLGYVPTKETLQKLRKPKPEGFGEKISRRFKGIPKTETQKQKQKEKMIGRIPWNKGKKGMQIAWNKGKKCPEISGEKNPMWGKKRPDLVKRNKERKKL